MDTKVRLEQVEYPNLNSKLAVVWVQVALTQATRKVNAHGSIFTSMNSKLLANIGLEECPEYVGFEEFEFKILI